MRKTNIRKSKEESIKDFQNKINSGNNLVDYFLTIGIKPEVFKNQWLYESSLEELNSIYKEQLKPEIINKFPSFEKKYVGIDDTIIHHCFPLGFNIQEFGCENPSYKTFSILLDNNNFSTALPFKYVVCLIFYESINEYRKLYDKYYNNVNVNSSKTIKINNSFNLEATKFFYNFDKMSNLSCYNFNNSILKNKKLNNNSVISTNSNISDFTQKETNFTSFLKYKN